MDMVTSEDEETGEVSTKRVYLPTIMNKKDIEDIYPCVTEKGVLYKNISIIKKYTGDNYTVVGNYKTINNAIENISINKQKIGYR